MLSRSYAGIGFLGFLLFCCLLMMSACGGRGPTVQVYDSAHVLNARQVQKAGTNLSNNVDVYTTNTFSGSQAAFRRAVEAKVASDPDRVVMGIDTLHHYVYVANGSNVPLTSADRARAINAFAANYGNGNYTKSTTAAIGSMNSSLQAYNNASTGNSSVPFAAIVLPVIAAAGLGFLLFKSRQTGAFGRVPVPARQGYTPFNQQAAEDYRTGEPRDSFQDRGSGGRFGTGGSDYETGEQSRGSGGRFGTGGSDYETGEQERGNGGSFGTGGNKRQL
jgi:hypothetical protein